MFESHVVASLDGTSFDFRFEDFLEQSAFVNNHLLCYRPTIHNSISKICPKFQVLSFTFSRLSIEQKWCEHCEVKLFQLHSMLNAIRCIDQRFAFKNSGSSCLALIFNLNNSRTTNLYTQKIGCRLRDTTSNIPFFSVI